MVSSAQRSQFMHQLCSVTRFGTTPVDEGPEHKGGDAGAPEGLFVQPVGV